MRPLFLVVDDHEDIRKLVKAMLLSNECDCEVAADGQEAVELLEKPENAERFTGILLDVMMPRMNGYEVLKQIQEWQHTTDIPVIMLTAKGEGDDIIEGYNNGADYYIPKPFTHEQIAYGLEIIMGEEND